MHSQSAGQEPVRHADEGVDAVQPCQCDLVGVAHAHGEYRLVVLKATAAGTVLFRVLGDETPVPTRYSVQIGKELHLDSGSGARTEDVVFRYFWRFMNHHCEPTTMIRGREVVALRDIAPWEDVTFNYNTTEANMAEPFLCRCGSARCEGTIRGARHLSAADRERLRSQMAPWLLAD